jgi:hypothetical protein
MTEIQLAIEGEDAVAATEALLAIPGISGSYQVNAEEPEREGVIATVATIVGIVGGAFGNQPKPLAIAKRCRPEADRAKYCGSDTFSVSFPPERCAFTQYSVGAASRNQKLTRFARYSLLKEILIC